MLNPQPLTSETAKNYQTYLVNLSTINQVKPISAVLNEFADLHYQYAQSWLGRWYSQLWVALKYATLTSSIKDFKLGLINTDKFISKLQTIFYFIPEEKNPKALLAKAWNSVIDWNEESTTRLTSLVNEHKPIYFISNTNPLNIERIIELFNANYAEIAWQLPTEETEPKPLKLAENFFLCPSYQFKELKEGTPGLIQDVTQLLLQQGETLENMLLVSQYQPDLNKATELGMDSQSASEFYSGLENTKQLSESNIANNTLSAADESISFQLTKSSSIADKPSLTRRSGGKLFETAQQPHNDEENSQTTEKSKLIPK